MPQNFGNFESKTDFFLLFWELSKKKKYKKQKEIAIWTFAGSK